MTTNLNDLHIKFPDHPYLTAHSDQDPVFVGSVHDQDIHFLQESTTNYRYLVIWGDQPNECFLINPDIFNGATPIPEPLTDLIMVIQAHNNLLK